MTALPFTCLVPELWSTDSIKAALDSNSSARRRQVFARWANLSRSLGDEAFCASRVQFNACSRHSFGFPGIALTLGKGGMTRSQIDSERAFRINAKLGTVRTIKNSWSWFYPRNRFLGLRLEDFERLEMAVNNHQPSALAPIALQRENPGLSPAGFFTMKWSSSSRADRCGAWFCLSPSALSTCGA
jgi:hypothetical protein